MFTLLTAALFAFVTAAACQTVRSPEGRPLRRSERTFTGDVCYLVGLR